MSVRIGFKTGRGLDAIRDSRIAFQDGFRDTPWSYAASEVRSGRVFHEDCERGASGIISRKARRR
jgi:hypothetical protein